MAKARRRRDERGAVLMMVATTAVVLVLMGAFAVDIGSQRVGRRDMQALADLVALDMARQINGTTKTSVLTASAAWNNQLLQSVARNSTTLGEDPTVTAVPGVVDPVTNVFTATGPNDIPTAVKVTAKSRVPYSFVPGRKGDFNRTAVAQTESSACFGLGSYAAALDTNKSQLLYPLLREALHTSLNLQAIGYNGLASTTITMLDLVNVDRLNVGTTDELLATTVSAKDFYLAVADALTAEGKTAEATLVQNIAVHIGAVVSTVNIGSLLTISQGNTAALGTTLNVFNLLTGAAFLANGSSAIAVQGLGLSLPLFGTVSGGLSVIQKPVQNCGKKGTTLHTEQVTVGPLSANLNSIPTVTIPGLTAVTVTSPSATSVSAHLAGADATLTDLTCSPGSITVQTTSELAGATLSVPLTVKAKLGLQLPLGLLGALINTVVDLDLPVTVTVTTSQAGNQIKSVTMSVPPFDAKSSTGSGTIGLVGASSSISLGSGWTAKVAGLDVKNNALTGTTVTTAVNNLLPTILNNLMSQVVTPVASMVDTAIIAPLQNLLGLTVAGADVFTRAYAPKCNNPVLKGK